LDCIISNIPDASTVLCSSLDAIRVGYIVGANHIPFVVTTSIPGVWSVGQLWASRLIYEIWENLAERTIGWSRCWWGKGINVDIDVRIVFASVPFGPPILNDILWAACGRSKAVRGKCMRGTTPVTNWATLEIAE